MKEFAGKVAGITGAANGIGEAFALEAARRGMNLALIDIEGDRLQEVKKECEALGAPKVVAITVDVSEYEQVRMSVKRIMAEFDRIDVFFSNAGVAGAGTLGNIPAQDWDWITSVNFLGMAYYVTEVLPIMKKQGTDAYFLFTVSIGGLQPHPVGLHRVQARGAESCRECEGLRRQLRAVHRCDRVLPGIRQHHDLGQREAPPREVPEAV